MQRVAVTSSNIKSVGYDPESRILEVEFTSGWIYQYSGVPQSLHAALMQASSHGRYFASHIKKAPKAKKEQGNNKQSRLSEHTNDKERSRFD